MPLYTPFEPPRGASRMDRARRVAFVRDGFSWGAFLVAPVWLVWRRMWWVLAAYVVAAIVFVVLMAWWSPGGFAAFAIGFGLSLAFGFEANGLRRWSLRRKHWHEAGPVAGSDRIMAEHVFFARWLGQTAPAA